MILRHMSGACYCQAKEQSFRGKMGNRQSIYLSAPVYVYVCERERERVELFFLNNNKYI
jgi:hypothetical protein